MIKPTRRNLIRFLTAAAAYIPTSALLAVPMGKPGSQASIAALGPYLDTLLPQDSSPSATQLGVDRAIVDRFKRNKELARLVELGCGWLDQQARREGAADFASLGPDQRESIVAAAEASIAQSLPLIFFSVTHGLAMLHYYTQAESWTGMGYSGPPQPAGYPGHDKAPAEAAAG